MKQLSSLDFKCWKMGITTREMAMGMYKMFEAIQKTTKSFGEIRENIINATKMLHKEGK